MAQIRIEEVPAQPVAVVRRQVPVTALPAFFAEAAATIEAAVTAAGGVVAGPLFGWYHEPPTGVVVDVSAGFAVAGLSVGDLGEVEVRVRPAALAAVALHVGPYHALADTYRELDVWLDTRQLDPAEEVWEEYLSDPEADPDPATWETRLVRPLV